ncbi:PepSY domain-containing protein [Cohnella mopanensis]|uniref:PepSY domain-containing protein n=1 Tax=Cohnella mopanensis TaxID=2911966 RepID=UPI001EF8C1B3|nr:PepSY domain-containing protein [Cohnella mopanensis]
MNKKLMVGALAVALVGGGIAGASLLPSTNAATPVIADATDSVQQDHDQQDNDVEVNDDGAQGEQDNDQEMDGVQGEQDNDQEVNDDGAQAPVISKQQIIDIAVKKTPGNVTSVQLETEDGVTAYAVTIKDAAGIIHELTIDATTGKIMPEND